MKNIITLLTILVLNIVSIYSQKDTLKLTFPTENDVLVAGSDTLITWAGIPELDIVSIEYSMNNGISWILLSDEAIGHKYLWKNIPTNERLKIRLISICLQKSIEVHAIEWQKSFEDSQANHIEKTDGGGFIVIGDVYSTNDDFPNSKGSSDFWVMKLEDDGSIDWQNRYGGSRIDCGSNIKQIKDRGFIILGETNSLDGDISNRELMKVENCVHMSPLLLIKLNNQGVKEWDRCYFGRISFSAVNNIVPSFDNGFFVTAGNNQFCPQFSKAFIKTNNYGEEEWFITGQELGLLYIYNTIQTLDSSFISIGYSSKYYNDSVNGLCDAVLTKTNKFGEIVLKKYFGSDSLDIAFDIKQTEDKGYIILGWKATNHPQTNTNAKGNYWVLKLDSAENIIWESIIGGTNLEGSPFIYPVKHKNMWPISTNIIITSDGGYIFTGTTNSNDGDISHNHGKNDVWVVKLNNKGKIEWERTYGGSEDDFATCIQEIRDNEYIVCGASSSLDQDLLQQNKGGKNAWVFKISDIPIVFPPDTCTTDISIVSPFPKAKDIDMLQCYINESKDSVITNYITNIGNYKFRVDSIYITGADASAFSLISGFPIYNVEPNEGHNAEFRFTPSRIGEHKAEIVIITQADTLHQNIIGEGIKKLAEIEAEVKAYADLICDNTTSSELTIKNTGDDILKINEINIIGDVQDDFSFNTTLPLEIQGDSIKIINIIFAPKTTGTKTAQIEIISNADNSQNLTIDIRGRKDSIALVPEFTNINFGYLLPNETRDTIIKINNLGTILTDGTAELSSNLTSNNSDFSIEATEFHNLQISFVGISDEGNFTENIIIKDNICNYSREIILTGIIEAPKIALKKPIFGNTLLCDTQTENLNIKNTSVSTPTTVFLSQSTITGLDANTFSFGINDALLIEPQNNIDIPINFNPTEVKDYEANINLKIEYALDTTINISGVGVQIVPSTNPNTLSMQLKKDYTLPFIVDIPQTQKGYIDKWEFEIIKNNDVLYFKENSFNPVEKAITWDTPIETANGKMTISGTGRIDVSNGYVGELFNLKYSGLLDELTTDDIYFNVIYNCDTIDFNVQTINIEEICNANLRLINHSENENNILSPYPNPITNTFVLNYSVAFDNSAIEIELINSIGQTVKILINDSKNAGKYSKTIDISKIPNGLYYIKYTNGKDIKTVKIIINK